jgi:hypothetical protein
MVDKVIPRLWVLPVASARPPPPWRGSAGLRYPHRTPPFIVSSARKSPLYCHCLVAYTHSHPHRCQEDLDGDAAKRLRPGGGGLAQDQVRCLSLCRVCCACVCAFARAHVVRPFVQPNALDAHRVGLGVWRLLACFCMQLPWQTLHFVAQCE